MILVLLLYCSAEILLCIICFILVGTVCTNGLWIYIIQINWVISEKQSYSVNIYRLSNNICSEIQRNFKRFTFEWQPVINKNETLSNMINREIFQLCWLAKLSRCWLSACALRAQSGILTWIPYVLLVKKI